MKSKVLIIEDSTDLWKSITRTIRHAKLPLETVCVSNFTDAIVNLKNCPPSLIICDYYLPNFRNGLEVWKHCKGICPTVPFLIISGMSAEQYLNHVKGLPVFPAFLAKPFTLNELKETIATLYFNLPHTTHKAA